MGFLPVLSNIGSPMKSWLPNFQTVTKSSRWKSINVSISFRNSIATPALIASIINCKYTNALPLERQAKTYKKFLKTFSGTVVTDGYQVYHKLEKEREDLIVAGCWIHARRPFADLPISDRKKQRQLVLSDKVDAYFAWIKQKYAQVTPNGSTGKALAYSINQEKYLRVFLTDGNIPIDNNYAKQAIRPFTLGRKNFVLIESSNGAKASAVLYSLVETAKANGLNTFEYFNLLLTEIPQHVDDNILRFLDNLLPWSPLVQKACPSKYKKS